MVDNKVDLVLDLDGEVVNEEDYLEDQGPSLEVDYLDITSLDDERDSKKRQDDFFDNCFISVINAIISKDGASSMSYDKNQQIETAFSYATQALQKIK